MQTQSHVLLALALLSKKDRPKRNRMVFAGALIPDAFIYLMWAYYTVSGNTQSHIWDVLYFQNPTQFWDALFNSVPIFLTIALLGWIATRSGKYKTFGMLACVFGLGALIHIATDFPVHASDAHRHFWPISDWRFFSPFSYWESDHHAKWVGVAEAILGMILCAVLWKKFPKPWVKIILGIFIAIYIITFIASLFFMSGVSSNPP